MNIIYLLESTDLCGGVKVVFNHAAYLLEKGHFAAILSPDPYPNWFNKNVIFRRVDLKLFHAVEFFDDIDFMIATSPFHLNYVYNYLYCDSSKKCQSQTAQHHPTKNYENSHHKKRDIKQKLVHFVQGYEGDYSEAEQFIETINRAYSLDIPKITVSDRLSKRLSALYPKKIFMTCGQGLENDIFFPTIDLVERLSLTNLNEPLLTNVHSEFVDNKLYNSVFLIGPFDISIKRIEDGLQAFKKASAQNSSLKLIRVSAIDTRAAEESLIGKIDEFHVKLSPWEIGEMFRRKSGILISPSSSGEGFGLPAIEAMACGVPTVLTDIPSYRHFSSPDNYSLFVPVGNIQKMAEAILELSKNNQLRYQLIKRGIEVSGEYSYSNVVERLEICLNNI